MAWDVETERGKRGATSRPAAHGSALRSAFSWHVVKRSLLIATAVGTVLNLINQGDAIAGNAEVEWGKLILTFCVPFFSATLGAYAAQGDVQCEGRLRDVTMSHEDLG